MGQLTRLYDDLEETYKKGGVKGSMPFFVANSLEDDYLTSGSYKFKKACKEFICFLYWNVFKSKKNWYFIYR